MTVSGLLLKKGGGCKEGVKGGGRGVRRKDVGEVDKKVDEEEETEEEKEEKLEEEEKEEIENERGGGTINEAIVWKGLNGDK